MMKHIAQQFDDGRPDSPLCDVFTHPVFDSLVPDVLDAQCLECKTAWGLRLNIGYKTDGTLTADALTNGELWEEVLAEAYRKRAQTRRGCRSITPLAYVHRLWPQPHVQTERLIELLCL